MLAVAEVSPRPGKKRRSISDNGIPRRSSVHIARLAQRRGDRYGSDSTNSGEASLLVKGHLYGATVSGQGVLDAR